jgi:hypothetical protein
MISGPNTLLDLMSSSGDREFLDVEQIRLAIDIQNVSLYELRWHQQRLRRQLSAHHAIKFAAFSEMVVVKCREDHAYRGGVSVARYYMNHILADLQTSCETIRSSMPTLPQWKTPRIICRTVDELRAESQQVI